MPISVSEQGEFLDARKHVYPQTVALYGLTAYYGATGEPRALEAAQRCFATLEAHAYDAKHGGYVEWFECDWTPIEDPASSYIGSGSQKTLSTHMHIVEAFGELYRVWPDPLLRERCKELLALQLQTFPDPCYPRNRDRFEADWSIVDDPANEVVAYGHDLECVWFALDCVDAIGVSADPYLPWAHAIVDACLKRGFDRRRGGFFYSGHQGRGGRDTRKFSWTQAEAMVCLLSLYVRTRRPDDYVAFHATLRFAGRELIVPDGGSWVATRADGSRWPGVTRSGDWQAAYHVGRALLFCAEMLDVLAAEAEYGKAEE